MTASDLAVEGPWLALGGAISLLCTNGLRKQSSGHVEPPFLVVRVIAIESLLICAGWKVIESVSSFPDKGTCVWTLSIG